MAMIQTKGLYKSLLGTEEQPNKPAPLAKGASNDEKKNHKVLKDAYEKEFADIKEKRNNVWCPMALTLDASTVMLMRHDCLGDDGIGDGAKAWMLLQERFCECGDADSGHFGGTACSTAALRIWTASSSEDRSCSQGYKQGKQSQRPSSTLWSSIVYQ